MKLVMVVTKLTGNEENDRARAQEYCRYAAHKGVIPVSAYLNFHGMFLDELGGAVEHVLAARLAKQRRMEDACREYGGRAKYFDARKIGEDLLLCTMFSEELIEKLEEMEEF